MVCVNQKKTGKLYCLILLCFKPCSNTISKHKQSVDLVLDCCHCPNPQKSQSTNLDKCNVDHNQNYEIYFISERRQPGNNDLMFIFNHWGIESDNNHGNCLAIPFCCPGVISIIHRTGVSWRFLSGWANRIGIAVQEYYPGKVLGGQKESNCS